MRILSTAFLACFLAFTSCSMMKNKADTIIFNGKITTVDENGTTVAAMAIKDGKILAVGTTDDIINTYSADSVFDLGGKPVFPGFIDAHCHFYGLALSQMWVDLRGAGSFGEVLERMKERARKDPSGWLVGRGWDHNLWPEKTFPDRARLDEMFPGRPVVLMRIDGHSLLASQAALDAAGIGTGEAFTPQEVEKVDGRLTGILSENAADKVRSAIPSPTGKDLEKLLSEAQEICIRAGLTGVTDAGLDRDVILFIDSLQKQGVLKIRVSAMLNPTPENFTRFVENGPYRTDLLHVSAIKVYADGSLGSRTALMKKPYSDDPSKTGVEVTSPDSIRSICATALDYGYQVNTHCIGDSAVAMVLKIYGEYLEETNDKRWRIEHAQVVDPADMHLFGEFSVIPSVQATHATSDMYWAGERLGPERLKGAYAYRELMEQNGWIPNGTDFPIEQVSPLLTFYAAVSRKDLKGYPEGGFQPENALSRQEALKSITLWAAMSDFDEDVAGSLEPGKRADFVVLDRDILSIPEEEIPMTRVMETWIGGIRQ